MDARNDYLQQAADRIEAEAEQMSLRADRAQLLNIAQECRDLARYLDEWSEVQQARPRSRVGRPLKG
jgi:hypothetical protein